VLYKGNDPRLKDLYNKTHIAENLKRTQQTPLFHPLMKERLERYQRKSEEFGLDSHGQLLGKDQPGRHAEVLATNRLLLEMEQRGVQIQNQQELDNLLKDVIIYNGYVPNKEGKHKPGESIIRCSNCQVLTDGAISLSDLPLEFWQKHVPEYTNRITSPTILNHLKQSYEEENK
jgi:YwqJ-like deaminase